MTYTAQGTYTVTWTYDDGNGNVSTQTQTVIVDDVTPPVITCPVDISVGECEASVSFAATATDNCSAVVSYNIGGTPITSPHTFPVGTTVVEAVATDPGGNTDSCTFSVTIDPVVQVSDAVVQATVGSESGPSWPVDSAYPSFNMCIDPLVTSNYFLDIDTLSSSVALQAGVLNAFTLDQTSLPANWLPYWAAKGVSTPPNAQPWQDQMWDIINGNAPFFYIKLTTGSDYLLIDGLQYALSGGEPILRVPGDYPQHNYQYTGTVEDVNGCVSSFFDVFFQFNTVPAPTIAGSSSVCAGSVETYSTEAGQANYTWTVIGGSGSSTTDSITVTWGAAGPGSVSVNYDNAGGCTAAAATELAVTINALPTPSIVGSDTVCPNSVEIYTTESGMANYSWTVTGGTGASSTDSITVTWGAAGPGSVSVNYDNSNGCSAAAGTAKNVTITAVADLAVTMSASPNPIYVGDNLVYTITASNAGPCAATGVQMTYLLTPGQVTLMLTNEMDPGMACLTPGPAAWWRAENNADDQSGANDGTPAGSMTYAAGIVGQAFSFDGLTASLSVPDAPALRPGSLSIEGWTKIGDVTGVHVLVGKRVGTGTLDSYSIWMESGVLYASIANASGSGSFLRYPEFPTYSYFQGDDLVDLQSFASKLQTPTEQVSQFIKTNLSAPTLLLLNAYSGGTNDTLHAALIQDLNVIIGGGSIYDPTRFAAVTLSPESQYILGRNPVGEDLVRQNRYLIRDAYPAEFAADVFPQLNQWFHVAYSFDEATDVQALYINGELVDVGFETNAIGYDTHPLIIGADDDSGSPGYFFQGLIDELAVYDRALTGSEIQAIYQVGTAGKRLTPVVQLGTMPAYSTRQVRLVVMPTNCPTVTGGAVVSGTTYDPSSVDNGANVITSVLDLPSNLWVMGIEEVSPNSESVRITWPITCGPAALESTPSLNPPAVWSPFTVPVQVHDSRRTTVVPSDEIMEYFRMLAP